MKVLVTGSMGQLGVEVIKKFSPEHDVFGFDVELDVTKADEVISKVSDISPQLVIHCAALTNVDYCETHPEENYRVNALGTENVALAAQRVKAVMVYVSTDYVFDGKKNAPYNEYDIPNPVNHYGLAKYAGELAVKSLLQRYYIVRTSWLFSRHGKNFPNTILARAREQKLLKVVNDQIGSPTYAADLAECIHSLVQSELYGTYHASNEGQCSWYEFASKLIERAGLKGVEIEPVSSDQYPSPTKRPAYSVLDNFCLRQRGIYRFRSYEEAIEDFFAGQV